MSHPIIKVDERHHTTPNGDITVEALQAWLATLPEEWKKTKVHAVFGSFPAGLKRIVAFKSKDGKFQGICVNSMGTHLPFDDSLEWIHVLS